MTKHACAAAPAGVSKSQLETALGSVCGENKTVDSRSSDQQFEALTKYGTDLTAKAAHLDPIIGRDEEVRTSYPKKILTMTPDHAPHVFVLYCCGWLNITVRI